MPGIKPGPSPNALGICIAVAASLIFGAHAPAERGVFADGGNVVMVAFVTTWCRALSLWFYCLFKKRALFRSREDFRQAAMGGAFQIASVFCIFGALLYLSAPIVIIIIFSHTLMLLFFMAWRGEIKLDAATVATTVTALAGLSFVIDLWHAQPRGTWIGVGLAFCSALATLSRLYVYGHQTKARDPAVVGAESFLIAALLASAALLFVHPQLPATPAGYGWLAVASVSLSGGTFCMFYGISLLGSFRYSLFCKVEPVFTSLFSVWFLGEILKPRQYLGVAIVISSLALYQIFQQKRMN